MARGMVLNPTGLLQALYRDQREQEGRIREDGRVHLTPERKDVLLYVCGGLGGLHATGLQSFGTSLSQTRPIATS
jgi:hypothetical protein